MKVFLVFAHAEPRSFDGALFRTAQPTATQSVGAFLKCVRDIMHKP
jgi:putative NADPH-quinone reductase